MTVWEVLPTWLTTIATLGALGAAIWAGLTARRLYAIEAQRDLVAETDRLSLKAQGVAVWCAAEMDGEDDKTASYGLVLQNTSGDVIYELHAESTRKTTRNGKSVGTPNPKAYVIMLPPGTFYLEAAPGDGHEWGLAKDVRYMSKEVRPITRSPHIAVTSLSFRDSANRTWSRTNSGKLTLLES